MNILQELRYKMKRPLIIVYVILSLLTDSFSQYTPPFVEKECYLNTDLDLKDAWDEKIRTQISLWGFESPYLSKLRTKNEFIRNSKYSQSLDSIYKECIFFLQQHLSSNTICKQLELSNFEYSYKDYTETKIKGTITFSFFYQHRLTRKFLNHDLIEFNFNEVKDNQLIVNFLTSLPECLPKEDCQFPSFSENEWTRKAIQDGFIDGTENLHFERKDLKYQLISFAEGLDQKRVLFYSLKSGNFVRDSLISESGFWGPTTSEYFKKADLVLDASCFKIESNTARNSQGSKRFYFKVHHILKGAIKKDTILVQNTRGLKMRSIETSEKIKRAILFLEKEPSESNYPYSDLSVSKDFETFYPLVYKGQYVINNDRKFYTELLPSITPLESISRISQPENPRKINVFLTKNNRKDLIPKHGLIGSFNYSGWDIDNKAMISNLFFFSTKDYTYPTSLNFDIKYDTSVIGSNLVKKGKITLRRFQTFNKVKDPGIQPHITFSENYLYELIDVKPNVFQIRVTAKDYSKLCQLPLQDGSIDDYSYKPVASILVNGDDVNEDFQMEVIDRGLPYGKHYDPVLKKILPYDFLYLENNKSKVYILGKRPKIDSISYKTFLPGDTVTIHGHNIKRFKSVTNHPCSITVDGIEMRRHCRVKREDIIDVTYNTIKYVVAPIYSYKDIYINKMKPISGTIRVQNYYSDFVPQAKE